MFTNLYDQNQKYKKFEINFKFNKLNDPNILKLCNLKTGEVKNPIEEQLLEKHLFNLYALHIQPNLTSLVFGKHRVPKMGSILPNKTYISRGNTFEIFLTPNKHGRILSGVSYYHLNITPMDLEFYNVFINGGRIFPSFSQDKQNPSSKNRAFGYHLLSIRSAPTWEIQKGVILHPLLRAIILIKINKNPYHYSRRLLIAYGTLIAVLHREFPQIKIYTNSFNKLKTLHAIGDANSIYFHLLTFLTLSFYELYSYLVSANTSIQNRITKFHTVTRPRFVASMHRLQLAWKSIRNKD